MSRDAVGATGPAGPSGPAGPPGPAVPDDLPDTTATTSRTVTAGPSPARPRRRVVAALLLAVAVGAAGALLAVRAQEASDVRLLLVAASPETAPTDAGELSVDLRVVGLGAQDATVVGGGSGAPGGGVAGRVEASDAPWVPRARAEEPPVVPAGGMQDLVLRLDASCDDPPPWRPWLRVQTAGGAEQVVEPETTGDPGAPAGDVLDHVCEYRQQTVLSPVSVVGQAVVVEGAARATARGAARGAAGGAGRAADAGAVSLALSNPTAARYRVMVEDGGISGLSFAGGEVELPAGSTTQVLLLVDPPRCAGALRVDDLVSDAGARVDRAGGGDDDGPVSAPLDLWAAQTQVALAVGRVCADT